MNELSRMRNRLTIEHPNWPTEKIRWVAMHALGMIGTSKE